MRGSRKRWTDSPPSLLIAVSPGTDGSPLRTGDHVVSQDPSSAQLAVDNRSFNNARIAPLSGITGRTASPVIRLPPPRPGEAQNKTQCTRHKPGTRPDEIQPV